MNMDVDVDAQRATSHTEISARSSSEFRVVNVRRIIHTQIRRSCVWRRTDASQGSVEAPLLFAFNGRAFPFIVIRERGSEDTESSLVKGVKAVLSVLKEP